MAEDKKRSLSLYEIGYIVVLLLLLCFGIFFMERPDVGILDVKRVMKGLGWEEQMQEEAKVWQEDANKEIKALEEKFTTLNNELTAKMNAAPTEAEKIKCRQQISQALQDFRVDSIDVRRRVQASQQKAVVDFRRRLDPFIIEVARKKRLRLVIQRSGRVLYAVSRVDITEAVIKDALPSFEAEPMNVEDLDDPDELDVLDKE